MSSAPTRAVAAAVSIRGLHHFAYRCRDCEETRHFYEDLLGLPLVHAMRSEQDPGGDRTIPCVQLFFALADGTCIAFFDVADAGPEEVAAVRWAADQGDAARALAIAPALHSVMGGSSRQRECAAMWQSVAPFLDTSAIETQWPILLGRAAASYSHFLAVKHPMQAHARAQQAIRVLSASTDHVGLYIAHDRLCWPAARIGEAGELHAALQAMRALEDPSWAPAVRLYRAECEYFASLAGGDFEGAMRWAHAQADCERSAGWTQSAAQTNAIHAAVTAGRVDEILNAARAEVARLLASRNRRSLALARYPLLAALLVAGAIDEARAVACDGWSDVVAFGMQAWWVDQLALLAALESRPHSAARLVGYADLLYAAAGERRDALRSASVKRAMKLAADALGEAALQKLKADGATLRDGDVPAVAFGDAGR